MPWAHSHTQTADMGQLQQEKTELKRILSLFDRCVWACGCCSLFSFEKESLLLVVHLVSFGP
jgi:hypothetical protein